MTPDQEYLQQVELPAGSTVGDAIRASGVLETVPEIDLAQTPVGVFSRRVELTEILTAGDRVELYRPLRVDPKEARRLRARAKAAKRS